MSSLESSKNLAGIGSLLLMLGFVPGAGWIIGIIGVVLLLMGVKGLASYYRDDNIYSNAVSGLIYYVIAIIAAAVALGGLTFGSMFGAFTTGNLIGMALGVLAFVVALIVAFVFFVLASARIRRSLTALGQKSGEHHFETAGSFFFIGAVTTIILVGFALLLVAWILVAIAFFSIKLPQQPYYTPPPIAQQQPSTTQATRYCPNCGAPVDQTATFCPNCGKQLPPA